jgi:RNA methyltransferase, TrmH family
MKTKFIASRHNPLFARLRQLCQEAASYRKYQQVWLEGDNLCSAYLHRGGQPLMAVVKQSLWEEASQLPPWISAAPEVVVLSDSLMAILSPLESAAPVAMVVQWSPAELATGRSTVILDRLQDPGNAGAILRCTSALGFTQVVALKGTVALWSPKVLRAGMGAHFALRLVEGVQPGDLSKLGLPLLATSSHADTLLYETRLPQPCAWVVGHEGQGICQEVLDLCQMTLGIPQPGGEESLNVAQATAVCLYESLRQQLLK